MGWRLGRVNLKSQDPLSLLCLPKAPMADQEMERQQLLKAMPRPRSSPRRNHLKGV